MSPSRQGQTMLGDVGNYVLRVVLGSRQVLSAVVKTRVIAALPM
jgi:hypothetical protein